MRLKKSFGDKIYLEWIDAISKGGWKSIDEVLHSKELYEESFCKTNAFYIGEDKTFIKVSHTIGKTNKNDILGILWIPKKWIIRVK